MTKLKPFQRAGVDKLRRRKYRGLLADDMGLGKSVQALFAAAESRARPVVIVCPAGLKYHWQNEAALHLNWRAEVLSGRKPPKRGIGLSFRVVIINYDILEKWLPWLRRLDPELIILDEVHFIKNRSALRTQFTQMLCNGVRKIIALSGTPLTNRPAELWVVCNLLWPKKFPSYTKYGFRYCQPSWEFGEIKFKGANRLDELHARLKRYGMIRRLKKDVLSELPPKTRTVLALPLSKPAEYARAESDFLSWLADNFGAGRARRAAHAKRLVQFGYLKRLAAELKMHAVREWIDNFLAGTDEKIIVFGVHKKILHGLLERYAGLAVLIDGGVTGRERQRAVEQFQKRKSTRIIFGNVIAAGTGWNGTAATTVAHVELPWTPGELNQAGDRPHRIGQTRGVNEYFLVARGTVEEKLCGILQDKQSTLNRVLDGDANAVELKILDQLTRLMLNDRKKR